MKTRLQNLKLQEQCKKQTAKGIFIQTFPRFIITCLLILSIIIGNAQVTITGASASANGTWTSLTRSNGAFAKLNGSSQSGRTITITITSNVLNEDGSNSLGNGGWTSVNIIPNGARTISGSVSNNPMIYFNGSDNVTINGLNSGGNSLIISNASTSGVFVIGSTATSTLFFKNDASNNTITNCSILGSSTHVQTGTIVFSTRNTNGNDGNTISNCNIGPAAGNLPYNAIFSLGSTGAVSRYNSGNIVSNNNIYDFFNASNSCNGIFLSTANTDWTISGNHFYQTANRTFTSAALRYAAIKIDNSGDGAFTGNNYQITNNIIGGNASSVGNTSGTTTISGSSNEVRGIDIVSVGATTATSIQGNIISGITQSTSRSSTSPTSSCFIGIMLNSTNAAGRFNVGNLAANTIGSLDGSSTIIINQSSTAANNAGVMGICDFSTSSNTISNNNIGAITIQGAGTTTGFLGIYTFTSSGSTETVTNNIIGGATAAGGITDSQVGSYIIRLIQCSSSIVTLTGNIIRNISSNSNSTGGVVVLSAIVTATLSGVSTISQNTIYSLNNNSASSDASIYVMDLDLSNSANIVERNLIHSISNTGSATAQIFGIYSRSGVGTYKNNLLRLGVDASGNSLTLGNQIVGIFHASLSAGNNFYHNSIYIGGTGVTPAAYTACFESDVENITRSYVNNIFYNARDNVAASISNIGLWLPSTVTGLTCNYNDLYTPSATGAIGVFNSTIYNTTLPVWVSGTTVDVNSVSDDPHFINPTGSIATLNLNIQTGSVCNNEALYISTVTNDYAGNLRDNSTVKIRDIGAYELQRGTVPGSWIGVTSSDWNTTTNWDNLVVPTAATDVYVAGGHPNFPVIPTGITAITKNLSLLRSNTSVSITGNGSMTVNGGITTIGLFDVSDGTINMNGSSAQTIPANAFVNNSLKNLIISNTDATTGVTLGGALDITESVNFAGSALKLTTGGFLTFKSTATKTAWLGDMTGRTIIGDATVERFIPDHPKAWQFLSTPTTGQTVKAAWQEGNSPLGNLVANRGTIITSNFAGTGGFDIVAGNTASMKTYDTIAKTWVGISGTNIQIANRKGYMLFVRGDRSVTGTPSNGHSATTLRTKGILYTPANAPAVINLSANTFESIGNPYASAIDLTQLSIAGGVQDIFYVWDPKLTNPANSPWGYGGYQTFVRNGSTYDVIPGGPLSSYPTDLCKRIESGQAFFVHAPLTAGSVTFTESCKATQSNIVTKGPFTEQPPVKFQQLRTRLSVITGGQNVLIDGNLVQFNSAWSNGVGIEDAVKIGNTGENLGIFRNNKILAVERRTTIQKSDTIFYQLGQLRVQEYEFEFTPNDMEQPGLTAFLEDKYLHTSTPVSLHGTTKARFNIVNIPGSYAADRFMLVFRKPFKPALSPNVEFVKADDTNKGEIAVVIEKTAGIIVYPNPVTDQTLQLQFNKQVPGNYNIQLINKSGQPVYNTNIQLESGNATRSIKLNKSIPAGSYQLLITAINGIKTTQQVIINN